MRSWIVLLSVILALLLPQSAAANAPAPYSLWFFFDQAPEAVQLIECRSRPPIAQLPTNLYLCEQPTLLLQHGTCTASGCFTAKPALKPGYKFQCAETACLYQEPVLNPAARTSVFQLIAQVSNQTRSSPAFTTHFRSRLAGYRYRYFTVSTQEKSLVVQPDTVMKPSRWEVFGTALGITQLSEFAIALLGLAVLQFDKSKIARVLLWIGFVNLLTFPVVWFFFPSLQAFQYRSTRIFGLFSLLNAIGFSLALVNRKAITTRTIIRTAIIWFFCLPIVLIVAFFFAALFGYGEPLPAAAGLPSAITLSTSEICVTLWEGWLLSQSQIGLSKRQSYGLALWMNLLSLALGLLVLPAIQQFG